MKWQIDRFLFSNKFHSFAKSMDTILSLALFAQFGSSAMIICSTVYLLSIVSRNVQSSKFIISHYLPIYEYCQWRIRLGQGHDTRIFWGPFLLPTGPQIAEIRFFFSNTGGPLGTASLAPTIIRHWSVSSR